MPSAFDIAEQALNQASPTGTPSAFDIAERALKADDLPTVVATQPEGKGFQFLPRSGAQMDVEEGRQAVQQMADIPFAEGLGEAGIEVLPQTGLQAARMVGEGVGGPAVSAVEGVTQSGKELASVIQEMQDGKSLSEAVQDVIGPRKTYPEFDARDWGRLTGKVGIAALQALPLVGEGLKLRTPTAPLRTEPLAPEPPPTQSMGPGTIAADVSNALDWTPQSPPITPLEQTIAKVQPPGPYVSPETGFTHYPGLGEGHAPVPSDWAYPPPGTPLKPVPLVGVNGETPAANVAAAQAQPQVPPVAAPEPYTQEAAAARSQQPSGAGPTVSSNVKGFSETYGPGEIPAGPTLTPEDAWDLAHERAVTQKSQPYGFVDRARTGAITPTEMGDLIYEHHRLVERAAGLEGTPDYNGAIDAAKAFANNVLKPAENAWHRSGQTMQIARPLNFETETAMNLSAERMKVEIKANEEAAAKRHVKENAKASKDVQESESKLVKAMDKEYSKGAKRPVKTAEQLRAQLADTEPCVL